MENFITQIEFFRFFNENIWDLNLSPSPSIKVIYKNKNRTIKRGSQLL